MHWKLLYTACTVVATLMPLPMHHAAGWHIRFVSNSYNCTIYTVVNANEWFPSPAGNPGMSLIINKIFLARNTSALGIFARSGAEDSRKSWISRSIPGQEDLSDILGFPAADGDHHCAAKAFYYCPAISSHRPRSQNILKEAHLNPEEDSRIKRARSHVSLEKSS